jgi:vacuolar protein-sorting-associated protein 4
MTSQDYIDKSILWSKRAVEADEAGDVTVAYKAYCKSLDWLEMARNHTAKTDGSKRRIEEAMWPLLTRAETLKPLATTVQPAMTESVGDVDSEDALLQKALASAVLSERPTTRLMDVAGLANVKQALREAVLYPVQAPQLWSDDETSWSGVLLYGPPGTGKTHIARAIAGESGCAFFSVSAADLVNKYVGQSERLVRALFSMARARRPAIIFIDEIESIVRARGDQTGHMDRVVTEFLKQVDGVGIDNRKLLILGATNLPWMIDGAALRRFDRRIYVPLPDADARSQLLANALLKAGATTDQLVEMVARTEGYSGSDIKVLLKEVGMRARRLVTEATHYRPCPREPGTFVPCPPDDELAIESTFEEWPDKTRLKAPLPSASQYLEALDAVKPTVSAADVERCASWGQ